MSQAPSLKSKAVSGALWKFLERMSAQLVSMSVTIILARLLTPEDYSIVGIVSIFFTFANVFITGGFNSALIQKKSADKEDYSSVLFLSLGISILLYTALYVFAPTIARMYEQPILVQVVRIMGLILPVNALKSIVCAYISAHLMFRKFFFATLGGTLVSAAVGIGMAYSGFGVWALVAQQMLNIVIDTLILLLTTRIPLVFKISIQKIRRLFAYGWKIFASSTLTAIYAEVNPLIIGLKYSGTDLAFYVKGKNFPNLLSTICNSTLSAVLFPVLSRFQDDKSELLRCTRRFIQTASFIIFPVMLGFLVISDNFVCLLLTDKWLPAAQYIRIFCISELFVSIHAGNCEAIKAMGRSDIFFRMEIVKKSCYFAIIGVTMLLTNTPEALAYSAIACTAVALLVNCYPNRKLLGYCVPDQLRDIFPNLLCAVIMCAIVWQIRLDGAPLIVEMLVQIVAGAIAYVVVCAITRNRNLLYVWKQLKSMLQK